MFEGRGVTKAPRFLSGIIAFCKALHPIPGHGRLWIVIPQQILEHPVCIFFWSDIFFGGDGTGVFSDPLGTGQWALRLQNWLRLRRLAGIKLNYDPPTTTNFFPFSLVTLFLVVALSVSLCRCEILRIIIR